MPWYTDDPLLDYERYEAEQYRKLKHHPRCSHCDEYIQSHYYHVNDGIICPDCLECDYRVDADEYLDF